MPHKKHTLKALRQDKKRRLQNRSTKSAMKSEIKKVDESIEANNPDAIKKNLNSALSIIAKTAKKKVIHPRKAARMQSRLTKRVNRMAKTKE